MSITTDLGHDLAERIVTRIFDELNGRSGVGLDMVDESIKQEITDACLAHVRAELEKLPF